MTGEEALFSASVALATVAIAVGAGVWQSRKNFEREHQAKLAIELAPEARRTLRQSMQDLTDASSADVGPTLDALARAMAVAELLDKESRRLAWEAFRRLEEAAAFWEPAVANIGRDDIGELQFALEGVEALEQHVLGRLRRERWRPVLPRRRPG